ncbi:zinc finger protein [Sarocladium implicatum]|nr:zinc finger protein [Sarocladium implicatum]
MWQRRYLNAPADNPFVPSECEDLFDPFPSEQTLTSIDGVRAPLTGLPKARKELSQWLACGATLPPDPEHERTGSYVNIGAGACGSVFTPLGYPVSIKIQKNFADNHNLRAEAVQHIEILGALERFPVADISVPRIYAYKDLKETNNFLKDHRKLHDVASTRVGLPMPLLICDRILPLPHAVRTHLITMFCPKELQKSARVNVANEDCLVRIYLGQERRDPHADPDSGPTKLFSLRNLKLYLNDMDSLLLDIQGMAFTMGQTLAVLHFVAKTDARDVEFVLGSTKTRKRLSRADLENKQGGSGEASNEGASVDYLEDLLDHSEYKMGLYLLDFNQCRTMPQDADGVKQAVTAYLNNDPYYPRPFKTTHCGVLAWRSFASAYLEQATWIMKDKARVNMLAGGFLRGIRAHYREKYVPAVARIAEQGGDEVVNNEIAHGLNEEN